jgi:hypothetical protein
MEKDLIEKLTLIKARYKGDSILSVSKIIDEAIELMESNCMTCKFEKWIGEIEGSRCKYHKRNLNFMFNQEIPLDKVGCKQWREK